MEITVTVNAPELAGAITKLALAIEGAAPQQTAPAPQPQAQTIPMPQPTAPVPQPQAPTTAQQTTAQPQQKALTLNDIATAGAGLVDQGKMQQVIELLGKYGVQAITQLQPTQFDAFAGELRALGAAI